MTTVTATDLAQAHSATLSGCRAELVSLDDEIAALIAEEEQARYGVQRSDPAKRSDGALAVTPIPTKIDTLAGKRERLARDIQIKQVLLEELQDDAEAEQLERGLAEAEAAIIAAEASVAELWSIFKRRAEELRGTWDKLAPSTDRFRPTAGREFSRVRPDRLRKSTASVSALRRALDGAAATMYKL